MKPGLYLILVLLSALPVKGQFLDSLARHLNTKPRFIFRFDTRNSFITSRPARILGFKAGWEFNDKLRIGLGYSFLRSEITKDRIIKLSNGEHELVKAKLRFSYVSPFFEYIFFESKRWEHAVPVQFGFGNSHFVYTNSEGLLLRESFKPVIIYEPAMTTHYKIFPWFGIGAGVGYRLMLLNNKATGENFNSPVYVIKIKIFLGDLYRGIFKRKADEQTGLVNFTQFE